jgi:hypothetical protein
MKILLDWMVEEGNYSKYRGKSNSGVKKNHFCTSLSAKMEAETKSKRNAKQVMSKIDYLEKSFKVAHTFVTSETGAGIQEKDGTDTFRSLVKKRCPYYYELCEIMADRSGTQPKVTNRNAADLDASTTEDEGDDEEEGEKESDASDAEGSYPGDEGVSSTSDSDYDTMENGSSNRLRCRSPRRSVPRVVDKVSAVSDEKSTLGSSKKSKKRKPTNPLIDDETAAMLAVAKDQSNEKMKEILRHNQVVEELERKKLKLEVTKMNQLSWKGKSQELEYKMKLMGDYTRLIHNGWSNEMILDMIPDMKMVIAAKQKQGQGNSNKSFARFQQPCFGDNDSDHDETSAPLPNAKDDGGNSDSSSDAVE